MVLVIMINDFVPDVKSQHLERVYLLLLDWVGKMNRSVKKIEVIYQLKVGSNCV